MRKDEKAQKPRRRIIIINNMLNKKEVADTLAKSLITGESMASIMLKAQMLASLLEN